MDNGEARYATPSVSLVSQPRTPHHWPDRCRLLQTSDTHTLQVHINELMDELHITAYIETAHIIKEHSIKNCQLAILPLSMTGRPLLLFRSLPHQFTPEHIISTGSTTTFQLPLFRRSFCLSF